MPRSRFCEPRSAKFPAMTDRTEPQTGDLWRYPYLWSREAARGEEEGRKYRPCVVAVRVFRKDGLTRIVFLPVTSLKPDSNTHGLEIPETEKRRSGLDTNKRLWIILDERNEDVLEESYFIEPDGYVGSFTPVFMKRIHQKLLEVLVAARSRGVRRR